MGTEAGGRGRLTFPATNHVEYHEYRTSRMSWARRAALGWDRPSDLRRNVGQEFGVVTITANEMAALCEVDDKVFAKWVQRDVVPVVHVDEVCDALGVHPMMVWPVEWMALYTLPERVGPPLSPEHEAAYLCAVRRGQARVVKSQGLAIVRHERDKARSRESKRRARALAATDR